MDKTIKTTEDEKITHYQKYKMTIDTNKKKWAKSERGKQLTRIRNLKYYYRKKNLYHPQLNPDGEFEKKYKRNNISYII